MKAKRHVKAGLEVSGVFCLIAMALVFAWVIRQDDYSVGVVKSVERAPAAQKLVIHVDVPFTSSRIVLGSSTLVDELRPGRWLIGKGALRQLGQWQILDLHSVTSAPGASITSRIQAAREGTGAFFARHRVLSLCLAVFLVLIGSSSIRWAGALALGFIFACGAWHMAILAQCEGLLPAQRPLEQIAVPAVGFLIGFCIAYGSHHGAIALVAQRLALVLALWTVIPALASHFGWHEPWVSLLCVFGVLVSPVFGIWVLASYFFCTGISASGLAAYASLLAMALLAYVVTPDDVWPKFLRPGLNSRVGVQVPLVKLLRGGMR
jgi:hypothetical protein